MNKTAIVITSIVCITILACCALTALSRRYTTVTIANPSGKGNKVLKFDRWSGQFYNTYGERIDWMHPPR